MTEIIRSITGFNKDVKNIKDMKIKYQSSYEIGLREYLSKKLDINETLLLPSTNKYIVTSPLVVTKRNNDKFVKLFIKDIKDCYNKKIPLIIVLSHDWKPPTDAVSYFLHNKNKFEIALQFIETFDNILKNAIENTGKIIKVNLKFLDILEFDNDKNKKTDDDDMLALDIDELIDLGKTLDNKKKIESVVNINTNKNDNNHNNYNNDNTKVEINSFLETIDVDINEKLTNNHQDIDDSESFNRKDEHKLSNKFTKIEEACIKLKVPNSGKKWLDKLILQSRHLDKNF